MAYCLYCTYQLTEKVGGRVTAFEFVEHIDLQITDRPYRFHFDPCGHKIEGIRGSWLTAVVLIRS